MTELEVINDIKQNKVGKIKRNDLIKMLDDARYICDKAKKDEPLSPEVLNGKNQYTPQVWRNVRNLEETINIFLDNKELWEEPKEGEKPTNDELYTSIDSTRQTLHNYLSYLLDRSQYKETYQWLETEEAFYQKDLMKRNERYSDSFKLADWKLGVKTELSTHPVSYSSGSFSISCADSVKGKDGNYYYIDKEGNVQTAEEHYLSNVIKNKGRTA